MRVAICDDVLGDRRVIASALGEYLRDRGLAAEIKEFSRPKALLAAVRINPFDLYLLDVLLDDNLTGIDLARRLQPNGSKVPVVFFSTSSEYAIDAFSVEAVSYLQKPWNKASFKRVIDLAMERCQAIRESLLTFHTGSAVVRFAATKIESVETAESVNYITIQCVDGGPITIRDSVRNFAKQHHDQVRLVSAGRSLLVNPAQIASLDNSSVRFFSGRIIAVPHSSLAPLAHEILSLSAP